MSEANPPGSAAPDPLETEFDLREGILILAAWWREILCLALVAMVLGTVMYAATLDYEAAQRDLEEFVSAGESKRVEQEIMEGWR